MTNILKDKFYIMRYLIGEVKSLVEKNNNSEEMRVMLINLMSIEGAYQNPLIITEEIYNSHMDNINETLDVLDSLPYLAEDSYYKELKKEIIIQNNYINYLYKHYDEIKNLGHDDLLFYCNSALEYAISRKSIFNEMANGILAEAEQNKTNKLEI